MKVSELIKYLNKFDEDLDVVIPLSEPAIGATKTSEIEVVYSGFDWDNGKLFLEPKKDLVVKTDKQSLFEEAKELIMHIATKPVKKIPYEVRHARQILDNMGVKYMEYQHIFHKEYKK